MDRQGKMATDETIAAIATPIGEGGIGIVRLSGGESLSIADKIFLSASGKKLSECGTFTTHYGKIRNPRTAGIIDEVIVTVMRSPKSYTREDVVEINCHGGLQSVKQVLDLTVEQGARIAEPGEFTRRAFLSGRIDLAQAEAVLDVIRAKTDGSLKVAMAQMDGELSRQVDAIREKILDITAELEASIDFPEEEIEAADRAKVSEGVDKAVDELGKLIRTYDEGQIFREGILTVICGKPNAGKSSLMNLLLKRDRVIVSSIPGTTRDAVEEMISLKGIPIRLADTAGIIDTADPLEIEGMARSKRYLAMADMVVLLLDNSTDFEKADRDIIAMCAGKKIIAVLNKTDLARKIDLEPARELLGGRRIVEISVFRRENIDLLEDEIAGAVWSGSFDQGQGAILSNARHKELLDRALANMLSVNKALDSDEPQEVVAIDLREAAQSLGLIIGKTVSDDILDRIFERFCIGK